MRYRRRGAAGRRRGSRRRVMRGRRTSRRVNRPLRIGYRI